ncbi:MAG TPA: FxsA family protein [Bacillota bacterium]|nr:FxsA family protein [Bacillota bacterium]
MLKALIALLIIIPILEIWGLLTAGKAIGWLPTLIICIFTGVLGAWLAKRQGLRVFYEASEQMRRGQLPGEAILDGIIIFTGGLVLLTPGFFTDLLGFILLVPFTRKFVKLFVKYWILRNLQKGRFVVMGWDRRQR